MATARPNSATRELGPAKGTSIVKAAGYRVRWLLMVVAVIAVLCIVLSPNRPAAGAQSHLRAWLDTANKGWLPPFITFELVEFLANVVMFVPIGVLGILVGGRGWPALISGTMFSVLLELFQALLLPGRVGSVVDVAANTMGVLCGVCVVALWRTRFRRPSDSDALRHPDISLGGSEASRPVK
ncbi:VanZ family protein [Nakamurella antarctica]|uniref:VanZ family protein n=1 Tax=Nakamurella antarctica TaxID=1902245 RepID=A0A3G8ZJH3_9ACTN|nr:VanZ family protein [Nakamurella antarctica]AZI57360.1 VanZ family protein [Nakamurella antarctica]